MTQDVVHSLPTITSQKIRTMICNSQVVLKESKTAISSCRTPLFHLSRNFSQSTKKRNKHVPIQGVPNKSCTVKDTLGLQATLIFTQHKIRNTMELKVQSGDRVKYYCSNRMTSFTRVCKITKYYQSKIQIKTFLSPLLIVSSKISNLEHPKAMIIIRDSERKIKLKKYTITLPILQLT